MKKWDEIQQKFALDNGWHFDDDEMLILTQKQFNDYHYSGKSIEDPKQRVLMIPCCLIFEGMHFKIEN